MPLSLLWARHGAVGRCFDVLGLWRQVARGGVDGHDMDCGHHLAEEAPEQVAAKMDAFFAP